MHDIPTQLPPEKRAERPVAARRPRRSFASRLLQSLRLRIHSAFAREQLIASLKSLVWVAPMTVLIWVYAEREQTAKQTISFRVDVRNADANRVIEVTDDKVTAEFSGPQARLEQVREVLESTGGARQVNVDPNLPPGKQEIELNELKNDPLFVKNGLTVSNLSPKRLTLVVDPIEHRFLEVKAPGSVTNLDGPALFDPPTVQISGPKSVLDAADMQGKLLAIAALKDLREPGFRELHDVRITPLSDSRLAIWPTAVSAKVTVKKSEVEGTIKSVPVWAVYPPIGIWDKYKASYDLSVTDVKVTGPAEMIEKMNNPAFETKPKAILDVSTATTSANPVGAEYEGSLTFDFGKSGLKISPDDPHKTIRFTVVERKTAE